MIDLPTDPAPRDVSLTLLDFGNTIAPFLGGPEQRINRLGSRYSLAVTMPPMRNAEQGQKFVSRLTRGKSEGVKMKLPLGGVNPGTAAEIGEPKIWVSTSGRTIRLKGFVEGYTIKEGQMFSVETGGTHYVYMSNTEATVSAGGNVNLEVSPLLRVPHLVDDRVHFLEPMIEGFIEGQDWQWSYALDHTVGIQFTVRERK